MGQVLDFKLNDEHKSIVRDCLEKAEIKSVSSTFDELVNRIEESIKEFRSVKPTATDRETRDALRSVYLLAKDNDPSPGQLLARLQSLPQRVREYLDDRAASLIPKLFPGEVADKGFLKWAKSAKDDKFLPRTEKLLRAFVSVSSEGAQIVEGRSRGDGKRSRDRLEPAIMGEVKGAKHHRSKGGRPRNDSHLRLIASLAGDWLHATGEMPTSGRSDETGFGNLVHCVFQWLGLVTKEHNAATYALRQYWTESARPRTPDFAMGSVSGPIFETMAYEDFETMVYEPKQSVPDNSGPSGGPVQKDRPTLEEICGLAKPPSGED
jgi:hypothetical protein